MSDLGALNSDFEDLLICFCEAAVDFLVVGAYAVALHGVPRATGDIDVLVRPTRENAAKVWAALARFGAPVASADVTAEDFANPGLVYQVGLPPRRIDILTAISGVSFEEAWASRVPFEVGTRTVYFIGRDALVRNKKASGRAKDLADVERLEGGPAR